MNLTWAISVLSFLSGGAGAYLGSYLRKKGENLATHEDIDKLVDQVRAVTTATKEIETRISSDLWDRQKQWELRRDILIGAAKSLSQAQNALLALHTYWRSKLKGEIDESMMSESTKATLEHQHVSAWWDAIRSLEEVETLILVTCSKETVSAFAELDDLLRQTAVAITSDKIEAYTESRDQRHGKFSAARVAIRRELGFLSPSALTRTVNALTEPPAK